MQVTLVYSVQPIDEYNVKNLQPLGIAYVGAVLEGSGYKVSLIDAQLEKSFAELMRHIVSTKPDVLGVSIYSLTYPLAKRVLSCATRLNPLLTVVGGPHVAACHVEVLKENKEVDVAVRGEGEYTTLEVVDHLSQGRSLSDVKGITYREKGKIKVNTSRAPISDLDALPLPARHLLRPLKDYGNNGTLVSSRGCPYQCAFCSVHQAYGEFGGSIWRARSPQNVVDEVEVLLNLGASSIDFVDDNFMVNRRRAEAIAMEIINRDLGINYQLGTRADLLIRRKSLLPILRKSGCRKIEIGAENGSASVLRRYDKGICPHQNAEAIRLIRENDIIPIMDWIMFDAEITVEELMENLSFIEKNGMEDSYRIFPTWLWPHPGTKLYQRYMAKRWLIKNAHSPFAYKIIDEDARLVFITFLKFLRNQDYWIVKNDHSLREIIQLLRLNTPKSFPEKKRLQNLESKLIRQNLQLRRVHYEVFKEIVTAAKSGQLDVRKQQTILRRSELRVNDLKTHIYRLSQEANGILAKS